MTKETFLNHQNHIKIKVIANEKSWIETKAIDQLSAQARLKAVEKVFGLPDLHPGRGVAVGSVTVSKDYVYPHLIGSDIGCGMALYALDLNANRFKQDRTAKKLEKREPNYEKCFKVNPPLLASSYENAFGTIGRGNHFAEYQRVDKIFDHELFEKTGLSKKQTILLIHSGSRGYGHYIYDKFIREESAQNGLEVQSKAFENYMAYHDDALRFARLNREYLAEEFAQYANTCLLNKAVLDHAHNYISNEDFKGQKLYFHRKGVTSSRISWAVIPGSRGHASYLVKPILSAASGFSIAHGAGRKWQRSMAKERLRNYRKNDLLTTEMKNRVVCGDKALLYEEAPQNYKDIEKVVNDLLTFRLIKVVARFIPLLTYKEF